MIETIMVTFLKAPGPSVQASSALDLLIMYQPVLVKVFHPAFNDP